MKIGKLSLQSKIISGSTLPMILVIILAVVAIFSVNSLLESSKWVDHTHAVVQEAMKIEASAVDMETGMRGYLLAGKEEFLEPYHGGAEKFHELVEELKKTVHDNLAQVKLLDEIEENINEWKTKVTEPAIELRREIGHADTMNDMADLIGEARGKIYFDKFRDQINAFIQREEELLMERKGEVQSAMGSGDATIAHLLDATRWVEHTYDVIGKAKEILATAVGMETGMRGYLLSGKEAFLEPYEAGEKAFYELTDNLSKTVYDNPAQVELLGEIKNTITAWEEKVAEPQIELRRKIGDARTMDDMADLVGQAKGKVYFDTFRGQIKTFREREEALMSARQAEADKTATRTDYVLIFGTLLTILLSLVISFFLGKALTRPINGIVEGLKESAEQVASASGQVSSSSQALAEGSSAQAASIEETSSSLEEMSTMTKQNAENASQADGLMKEANQVVGQASDSMTELTGSMEEISKASEDTSKIIKTIDEIAFQTNLLALNAAVEAARAGEAGAGFAVVADEVRNLAMRAAEAAKSTADLIEGTVKKVGDGSALVTKANEAFAQVAESTERVVGLVGEIAAASNEQSQGIDQINRAVADMDKVTQQNAANTEESASSAEEMTAQAEQLREYIGELVRLVDGKTGHDAFEHNDSVHINAFKEQRNKVSQEVKFLDAPKGKQKNTPEAVIPMDEADFKDF